MKTEEILAILTEKCADTVLPADKLAECINNGDFFEHERFVPYSAIQAAMNFIRQKEQDEECMRVANLPIKQFLFVEDGTVDVDNLEEDLGTKNPEIKLVVYRQGAKTPKLVDIRAKVDSTADEKETNHD